MKEQNVNNENKLVEIQETVNSNEKINDKS